MAAPILIFLPLAFLFVTATSQGQKNISLTDTLTPTSKSSWLSPSGVFAFGFYQRGNGFYVGVFLPGTSNKIAVWTYGRDNPPLPSNSTLRFDSSGKLVLQSAQAQDAYVATPIGTTASASMLDSGNFVLYNSSQGVIWQSFDWPTDTILGGQTLSAEQKLHSSASVTDPSTGLFLAIMQSDGVLALYPVGTPFTGAYGYWDSGRPNNGTNVTLHLEDDGFLYLLKPPSIYLSNFTSPGGPKEDMIYVARIDPDGLFRLYSYNTTRKDDWPVKYNVSIDRCSPKGICGLNAFCTNIDQDYACPCLPGFASVKDSNGNAGCERNFTAESCKNPPASYDMQPVSITIWEDATYSALTSLTQDECVEACRQDCNCEAVAYNATQFCSKQKLPLRFGGRLIGGNNSLLYVKVGNAGSGEDGRNGCEQKYTRREILIAVASSIAFAILMLAVSGLILYKNRVWVYKMLPKEGFQNN
ncbi:G-type lectin S-receptor-like serine/threonine-protein kinase LECRK1 [Syzygium oleosum]|uniref:G-type lectin S-receptor-like serine/threonine-protein kinase LECRK1 n=1 Tax=Syzygium oleosum TaxID=219896 RepID=UPI0011D28552|nr:G-type lectin S-receptor-like serine/threonine-protein kinase LECRK1 [Syzygium oleosum]